MSRSFIVLRIAAGALLLAGCSVRPGGDADLPPGAQPPASSEMQAVQPSRPSYPPRESATTQRNAPTVTMLTIEEGTVIEAKLDDSLSSATNRAGDVFTATVTKDVVVSGRRAIPEGSVLHGIVKVCTPAKRGAGNASLTIAFTGLELPDENPIPLMAGFTERTQSQKKRNAAIIGGSAAGGALLGRIIGKDTKGAVVGALAGGAAGTGIVMAKGGDQVKLSAGSIVSVKLEQSVEVPHRS
jgi:hypothetical protein